MLRTATRSILIAAGVAAFASVAPAHAGGITSRVGLTDTIDWSQLGPTSTVLSSPQTVMSVDGVTVTVSSAGGVFERRDEGDGWSGIFTPGEALLWDQGVGPDITLTFGTPVSAAGATIQADFFGAYTAQITVNGAETFSVNGDNTGAEDGSAPFIGWSGGPITTLQFELTSAADAPNDFAIGTVSLGTTTVPEPSTWAMMLLGFAGLGFAGYRSRKAVSFAA
jgi:hypothetical protein